MQDPRTEGVLSSLKVKFEYWAEYPVSKLISDEATQVRFKDNRRPKKEVDRYRDLLKAGAEFPPVVVMQGGQVVDGNTRWGAYDALRKAVIPAYVCQITSPALARRIGVELNSNHGKRMEKEELANWLATGNGSVGDDDALRITGWSPSTVRRVRGALQFEGRRTKLGVPLSTSLPDTVKAALNKITSPEVFADLTALADEAGLKPREISQVTGQVNETALTDVAAARSTVSELRAASGQRIEERRAGLRVTTPLHQQMSMHLGWAIKQGPSGLHDTNTHTGPRSKVLLEDALTVIREALARY